MIYYLLPFRRGIYNRYRKGMPQSEMLLKDLSVFVRQVLFLLKGQRQKRILAHPHFPSRGATIYRIATALGWEVTNKPSRKFDLAIYWEYATYRKEFEVLENLSKKEQVEVINLMNRDISKAKVDEQMLEAFGYATKIDPTTFEGKVVRKSNTNAVHDGTLVDCPCTPEEGFIYQRFIDSSVNEKEVMDLRIPIIHGEIPHLYLNYRNNGERFKNVPDRASLVKDIRTQLSANEMDQILSFARVSGLDYGELDVLRDCHDQRLYVVDANNTPQGPPKNLSKEEKLLAIQSYAECFKRNYLTSSGAMRSRA